MGLCCSHVGSHVQEGGEPFCPAVGYGGSTCCGQLVSHRSGGSAARPSAGNGLVRIHFPSPTIEAPARKFEDKLRHNLASPKEVQLTRHNEQQSGGFANQEAFDKEEIESYTLEVAEAGKRSPGLALIESYMTRTERRGSDVALFRPLAWSPRLG
jgi:hypothetical protein